jgi:DNA-binding CsgD family transcriptional regulator
LRASQLAADCGFAERRRDVLALGFVHLDGGGEQLRVPLGAEAAFHRLPAVRPPVAHHVKRCAARGLSDREIAGQLVLSPHTVHRHVANIRRKLGRTSRTAAVAEAARLGLL